MELSVKLWLRIFCMATAAAVLIAGAWVLFFYRDP